MNVRWDYTFGTHPAESARRAELEALIAAWWIAFRERAPAIDDLFSGRSDWDLPSWMGENLRAIDPALMWEFGPAVRGDGHRLVITPEQRRDLRPMVRHILRVAPKLDGWEFYAHRLPESLEMARETVDARCRKPSQLSEVSLTPGAHHRIDLTFSGPDVRRDSSNDDSDEDDGESAAEHEAFVLTETLLGEAILDCWIGGIRVQRRPKRGFLRLVGKRQPAPDSLPLEALKPRVDAMIADVLGGLTDKKTESETATWTLLKLEPEQQSDYPGQADLFVAKSPNLALWRATRADGFHDARFTRSGETFCYVKLDGSEGVDEETFADKAAIEDALDDLLIPPGWGCQIGGGTGLKYSYIELALTNCAEALPAIRRLLAEGNVPKRSWILFHDAERTSEWIGVYDDSPPPPSFEAG